MLARREPLGNVYAAALFATRLYDVDLERADSSEELRAAAGRSNDRVPAQFLLLPSR